VRKRVTWQALRCRMCGQRLYRAGGFVASPHWMSLPPLSDGGGEYVYCPETMGDLVAYFVPPKGEGT
jgi:hypothetical protein